MSDEVPIFYESTLVGRIQAAEGGLTFTYDPGWLARGSAFPLSVLMPLQEGLIPANTLVPWLMNLLPEGNALPVIGRNLGVAPEDVLGLITRVGRDTAGALSFGGPRATNGSDYLPIPDDQSLARIIAELPAKPFLAGEEGVSMSLAGAQEKLPVALIDGKLAIPLNGAPSTHILKPEISRLGGSVYNEALCMVLAGMVGMNVAEVTTGKAADRVYLLVKRYDRVQRASRQFRLHQEDFCQALGKPPGAKYEHNQTGVKGPGIKDFFGLVRNHMQASDILRLRDAIVLNLLLTNVDSHAKNYSLLLVGRNVTLAPLYDLMCGSVWPSVTQNMAQDIAKKNRGKYIAARHWRRMAEECGINGTALVRRVSELANMVAAKVDEAAAQVRSMPAGDHRILKECSDAIKARCDAALANLIEIVPDAAPKSEEPQRPPDDGASGGVAGGPR